MMASQKKGWIHSLLLFMVYVSIWTKHLGLAMPRHAPFCIDADETKEDLMFKSERFKPIILQHNQNNPPINTWLPGATPVPSTDYIGEILLTRMVVDDNILPTTDHVMRNLRNWVHIKIRALVALEGFYIQAIKAPLGVPFGEFVIDFECRDCYSIPISDATPTAQVVPCKGRPRSSARHPNALVVAGDVDSAFVLNEGLHFHFNWIESLCDDVPVFQFLIVAVKSWGTGSNTDYQIFNSPLYENEIADSWSGVPWPLDPTWKHNDTIVCHGHHGFTEAALSAKLSSKNASGIIRVNEEYDNCLMNNAMEDGYQCPPGPFTCTKPPLTKNDWMTRRQMDIQNALKNCEVCNSRSTRAIGTSARKIDIDPVGHNIRKRESLDQDGETDDEISTSSTQESDEDTDEVVENTDEPDARDSRGVSEISKESKTGETDDKLGDKDDLGFDLNGKDDMGARIEKLSKVDDPDEEFSSSDDLDLFNHDDYRYPVKKDSQIYPYIPRISGRKISGRKTGNNSVSSQSNEPKMSATILEYFKYQTQRLLQDVVKAHAILMVLCWCAFTAISCYVSRFHKEVTVITPGSGCFGLGRWLWGHTIYSYLSLCAMWTGVLLILPYMVIEVGSYGKKEMDKMAHIVLGAIAMVFFHFNHLLGWYRPLAPSPRGVYILVHIVFGYGSKLLAVIAAFKTSLPSSITIYIVLAEIFNVGMYAIATFVQCKIDKEMNFQPPRSYFPVPEGIDTFDADYKETSGINIFFLYLQSPILLCIHYLLQFIPFIVFAVSMCNVWEMDM